MINPRIEVNLKKILHNTRQIVKLCHSNSIEVMGVTKVFCANPDIAGTLVNGGVKYLADSRIDNIMGMSKINIPKVLLRIPMQSEIEYVVRYADYSLNSELSTIERLSKECIKHHKKHKVILMIDLGDLREGIWYEDAVESIDKIIKLEGIEIAGMGTNLTCYGGVIPTSKNLSILCDIAREIRSHYKIQLPIISGGNSSSLHLIKRGQIPQGINNLRIGEAIVLGKETAFGKRLEGLYEDAFVLYGEIVEIKEKPSVPLGDIGMDAFGGVPNFTDRGMRRRAILALGRQDVKLEGLLPSDSGIFVLGASSDHLIVDITDSSVEYEVGDEISFKLSYGSLLQAMTSRYVKKVILKEDIRDMKRFNEDIA